MDHEAALLTPSWNRSTTLLESSRFRRSDGNCERHRHVVRFAPDAVERSGVHQHSALGVVVTCGVATTTRGASYVCCDCDVDGVLCRSKVPPARPRSPQPRIPGPRAPQMEDLLSMNRPTFFLELAVGSCSRFPLAINETFCATSFPEPSDFPSLGFSVSMTVLIAAI